MKNTSAVAIQSNFNTLAHDVLTVILDFSSFNELKKMFVLSKKLYAAFQDLNERENIFSKLPLKKQYEVAIKIMRNSQFIDRDYHPSDDLVVHPPYFSGLFIVTVLNPFSLVKYSEFHHRSYFLNVRKFVYHETMSLLTLTEIAQFSCNFSQAIKKSEDNGLRYIPKGQFRVFLQGVSLLGIFVVASSPVWIAFIALFFALKTSADVHFNNTRIPCVDANWTDFGNASHAIFTACDDLSHRCNVLYGNTMNKGVGDDIMVQCHLTPGEAAIPGWLPTVIFIVALGVVGSALLAIYYRSGFFQRHFEIFNNLKNENDIFAESKARIEAGQKTLSLFFNNASKEAKDRIEATPTSLVPATHAI